ncbi:MAG: ATP-dependent sacrificial sulfur transferase LarE [Candidatus Adiutrix sp.]|jgi:uncharacterized protein|nr:ATP-dependent sacrificial sulfur transferase LarE [Candidatus Adiutrix sp.]
MTGLNGKFERLKEHLKRLGRVGLAFSGGVDSSFLLKAARDVLGDNVLAVTGRSLSFPARELEAAVAFARHLGVRHEIVDSEELSLDGFAQNPPNRCYLCKKALFAKIWEAAGAYGAETVIEASNADDEKDYRPGLQALRELKVVSPLREAGLTKDEVRRLSRAEGLPTWNKPSFACLASRFPYGQTISPEGLRRVNLAEQYLLDLGVRQVRVRFHDQGRLARIEVEAPDIARLASDEFRDLINTHFQSLGFSYVALDIGGYRSGSMNETLPAEAARPGGNPC